MESYIISTGAFLPGEPVANAEIPLYLGDFEGECETREKVLRMNGIQQRYYALDRQQRPTHDLYELGACAARRCLDSWGGDSGRISLLAAGTTNAPLVAPGVASILHHRLAQSHQLAHSLEISSQSGICTASAQALVGAIRAIRAGEHEYALAIGMEQPSDILKSSAMNPPHDREADRDLRKTKWFMSVFLRSMLSDGAGAFLLSCHPGDGLSFKVNWTYSRSFAHVTPLCMQLESRSLLLTQDVEVLAKHLRPCIETAIEGALAASGDSLDSYQMILPHLSSFFFERSMMGTLKTFSKGSSVPYWTNLETAGNTGAASAYIMLDEFARTQPIQPGDRIILFIPESGQFNFVLVSLTAVLNQT